MDEATEKLNYIQDKLENVSTTVFRIDKELAVTQQSLRDHTEHNAISGKQILEQLRCVNTGLQRNTDSLDMHMEQTYLLKTQQQSFQERLLPVEHAISNRLIGLEKYVEKINNVLWTLVKVALGLSFLVGLALTILKLIQEIKG